MARAPRWRRVLGRSALISSLAAAVTGGVAALTASERVLVFGSTALSRPALFLTVVLAAVAMAGGHLVSRAPGPLRDAEWAVVRGLVTSLLVVSLLLIPLVGFFVLIVGYGLWVFLAEPVPMVLSVVGVVVGAGVLRHGQPWTSGRAPGAGGPRHGWTARSGVRRVASALLTAGVVLLASRALLWGLFTADDDVVVATSPEGCTAVVRQTQIMFSGEAALYVAPPGSAIATRRAAYPLEETFPFPTDDVVLETSAEDVRIAVDSGGGLVEELAPCR